MRPSQLGANQLVTETTEGATTYYRYDGRGNTVAKQEAAGTTYYAYNTENLMTRIDFAAGGNSYYDYDADSKRVSQRTAEGFRQFVYQGPDMLALQMERDESEETVAQYTFGAGLEAMHRDGDSSFYHYNHLGTALALTGANEAVTDTYRHDAWGVLLASTGSTINPHTYVGRERYYRMPNAEMYHLGYRDYAQGLGRFMTVDPLCGGSEAYRYVRNRSGAHSDATGLLPVFWLHPELPDPPNGNGAEDRGEWLRDRLRELLGDLWDAWRGDPEMLYLCDAIVHDQRVAAREAAQERYDQCVGDCWRDVGCSPPPAGWPGWPPVGKEELIAPIVAACIVMKCKPTIAADLTKAEVLYLLDLQLCFFLYGFNPPMPPRGLWPIPRPLI